MTQASFSPMAVHLFCATCLGARTRICGKPSAAALRETLHRSQMASLRQWLGLQGRGLQSSSCPFSSSRRLAESAAARLASPALSSSPGEHPRADLPPFDMQICRRRDHTASFLVRLHGPAINSAGLNAFGMTAATDWASGSTSSAAVGTGISSFWADHIPRGSHAAYSQVL